MTLKRFHRSTIGLLLTVLLLTAAPLFSREPGDSSRDSSRDSRKLGENLQPKWNLAWKAAFETLKRDYQDEPSIREAITTRMARLMDATVALASSSIDFSRDICDYFESQKGLLEKEKTLGKKLRKAHTVYFEQALRKACGPRTLGELETWCEERSLAKEQAKVESVLQHVKGPVVKKDFRAHYRKRLQAREMRDRAVKAVRDFRRETALTVTEEIGDINGWMKGKGFCPPAIRGRLLDFISKLLRSQSHTTVREKLRRDLRALKHTAGAGKESKKLERKVERRLDRLLKQFSDRLLKAVDKGLKVGETGLAFDLLRHLLWIDPQSKRGHKGLGDVQVDGRWMRRFDALQLKKRRLVWDDRLAWVRVKDRERYEGGEYYDLDTRKWDTLEHLNKAHSDVDNFWHVVNWEDVSRRYAKAAG